MDLPVLSRFFIPLVPLFVAGPLACVIFWTRVMILKNFP